jgi:hypothetical protein
VRVVVQASLPQEQHLQISGFSTECGVTNATACITRSRRPKVMFSAARMALSNYCLVGQTQTGHESFNLCRFTSP